MTDTTRPRRRFRKLKIFGVTLIAMLLVGGFFLKRFMYAHEDPESLLELLKVGNAAPAFTAVDTRGTTQSLANHAGKWVVLEWFNHGCPATKKHYNLVNGVGNTQAMQKDYTKRGVIWLSVVSSGKARQGYHSSAKKANDVAEDKGATPTAIIRDTAGVLGRLYGARNTPQYAIVDPAGVLRYAGAIDDRPTFSSSSIPGATNYVRAALDSGLAGRPIAVAQTQPYGCEVKY